MGPPTPPPLRRRNSVAPEPPRWRARTVNFVLAFVALALVADALVGNRGLLETMHARRQYVELAAALARTRQENERLRDNIRRLREDPSAIESVAREELGLMREGEVLFIVRDAREADAPRR